MNSYLVTVTVTDPDTGKYSIEIPVQAKTTAHAKRIAHKAARQMGACYITDLTAERRYSNEGLSEAETQSATLRIY
jgi:hypothetical protein